MSRYLIIIERTSTGLSAYSPDLPGCVATGSTREELDGWYCYLQENLKFPFRALFIASSPVSPLKPGEQVEVIGMFDDERHEPGEIFVNIRWQRRQMAVP